MAYSKAGRDRPTESRFRLSYRAKAPAAAPPEGAAVTTAVSTAAGVKEAFLAGAAKEIKARDTDARMMAKKWFFCMDLMGFSG
jgi:hypothetical protein